MNKNLDFEKISYGFLTRDLGKNQKEGVKNARVCRVKQVHGEKVLHIRNKFDIEKFINIEADAMITAVPKVALTIVTADCVPLLFYDETKKVVAAAHGGWRGTAKKIAKAVVKGMGELYQCDPKNINAAIGPCIQACCYEVDKTVYESFKDKTFFEDKGVGHWMMDLGSITQLQLIQAGVPKKNISISPDCTACKLDKYFSYRKEGDKAGRQWSFILLNQ